ncbi:MAG: hypothetical protein RIS60_173 [Pseudomonadota bacterium]
MKKLIALILMTLSVSAMAQHGGHRHSPPNPHFNHHFKGHSNVHSQGHWVRGYGSGWGWGVPAVIGGLLVYEAVKQPVYVQPQTVIVQQEPVFTTQSNPTCTAWTEVHSSDGTITRTRTCSQ